MDKNFCDDTEKMSKVVGAAMGLCGVSAFPFHTFLRCVSAHYRHVLTLLKYFMYLKFGLNGNSFNKDEASLQ